MVGSDQVWNPDHFDEVYLLDFVPDNIRKISYASSIGVEQLPETLKGKYKKYLKRFDSISVRESKAADVIEKLVNKPVDVVLDPTFYWMVFRGICLLKSSLGKEFAAEVHSDILCWKPYFALGGSEDHFTGNRRACCCPSFGKYGLRR